MKARAAPGPRARIWLTEFQNKQKAQRDEMKLQHEEIKLKIDHV